MENDVITAGAQTELVVGTSATAANAVTRVVNATANAYYGTDLVDATITVTNAVTHASLMLLLLSAVLSLV